MSSVVIQGAVLDPAVFRPSAVEPSTRAFNAELASRLAGVPPIWSQPASVTRAAREAGRGIFGPLVLSERAVERTIAGGLRLRCFVPETVTGVYLHIHGGGFTLGGAHHNDPMLEELASAAQVAALSVEYRLAPEHPYPAGPDDCTAAAEWLLDNAQSEFGTSRLLIGGESAGANLAAVTLLRLRDRRGAHGFAAANLTFGVYDLSFTPGALRCPDNTLILNGAAIHWFHDQYLPDETRRRDPDVSPIYADLSNMPPALFTVGTADPLLDDSLYMCARWVAAGNPAQLAVYPGAVHGFVSYDFPAAHQARATINAFLRDAS
jgi:acetyl esterase/lipase